MEAMVVATEASADDAFRIQSRTPAPTNATRTLCLFEFGSDLIIFERTFRALAFGNSAPVRSPFQGTSHHAGVSGKLIRHNMFLILGYTGLRDNARTHTHTQPVHSAMLMFAFTADGRLGRDRQITNEGDSVGTQLEQLETVLRLTLQNAVAFSSTEVLSWFLNNEA